MRRVLVELGRVGVRPGEDVAGVLDDGALHAEADAEEWYLVLARVPDRRDLALDAARAEPARHQNAVDV